MEPISIEQAREYYGDADPAHDFDHILRVLALAERIGAAEGADMDILRPAVLLHDIGRPEEQRDGRCHAQVGAEKARTILSDWPTETVEAISHAIAAHRFRDDLQPQTLEAKILFDADKLDSIGAIGIARAYVVGGLHGQRLWGKVTPEYVQALRQDSSLARQNDSQDHTPAHEFAFKLSRIKDILFTATANQIAEERHHFMSDYFLRLEREVQGEL
ncbi:MAG TPA: HD domain-containing protein [Anaerolineae bacterium]|nr:HD domain-containing protein [Anaerolineae bacterium]